MQILKADTQVIVRIGPFVDSTDGVTPETGVTLGAADQAELLKHNGAATVDISASTWAAITGCGGWYDLTLTTGNTDTEGLLTVVVQDSSVCLPVFAHFMVVNANVYDSLYAAAAADYLQVDAIQISGDTQSATDLKDFADAGYDPATNKVQGVVLTDGCTALTGNTAQTGDSFARLGAPAGASVSADVAAVKGYVDDIGVAGAGLTAVPWNAAWDAEVQSECTDALNAYDPPTNTELNTAHTTTNGLITTVDTVVDAIKAKTDNLPAAPADDTSIDSQLATIAGYLDTEVAAILAAVDTEVAAIKAKTDNLPADPASETNVNANETKLDAIDTVVDAVKVVTDKVATALELDGVVYRYTANALEQAPSGGATVGQIADAVWDEAAADHVAAGSTGKKLNDVTGGSPVNIEHDSTVIVTDS